MNFNSQQFKSLFPLFEQSENQSLIYLDNAATTQKPQSVIDAVSQFYITQNGNAQRASHRLARNSTELIEATRLLATDFLGLDDSHIDEVVFTQGATDSINNVAYGLSDFFTEEDEILISHSEHHANLLPWQRLSKVSGATLRYFDDAQCEANITDRTKLIAITAASNVTGQINDLSLIAKIKKIFPNIIVLVDASQIACHIPLQVAHWQCDFLVCSAHKFYGPTGVGLLYGRREWLNKMSPLLVGGEMVDKVYLTESTYVQGAQRFEAGTSNAAAIAGLKACLLFWQQQDRIAMQAYEESLNDYLHLQLKSLCEQHSSIKLVTLPENNIGIAVLVAVDEQFSLSDLAHCLDDNNIAVRVGDHCAQLLWQSLSEKYGASKGLRISLSAYNTYTDVDRLLIVIKEFLSLIATPHKQTANDKLTASKTITQTISSSLVTDDLSGLQWQDLLAVKSWQQRYKILLGWGKPITVKPQLRQEQYLVKGCESEVWFQHYLEDGLHYFIIDSDSSIIKGLAALLLLWLNGKSTEEINAIDITAHYDQLGLQRHLSPSRMNGFSALLDQALSSVNTPA